jgi:hypothetical protein
MILICDFVGAIVVSMKDDNILSRVGKIEEIVSLDFKPCAVQ